MVIILSMVLAAIPRLTVNANPDPEIYVSPATISNAVTNNDYTVEIRVSNVADLYAWEFQLDYNSAILSFVSDSVVSGGLNAPTEVFVGNNTAGSLWWAVSTTYPTTTGITYVDQAIFQIVFHAVAVGTSSLHIHGDILADHNGNAITHNTADGSITVGSVDLSVTSIVVIDHGCSIYASDTYADGITPYYVPVLVTIDNVGTMVAGPFHVSLNVFWITGSLGDGSEELAVASLAAGTSCTLNFTAVFSPTHTHYYSLTATVDIHNEVVESNEANNVLTYSPGLGIPVTVMGDIKGNTGPVNILDAVIISQAWGAIPANAWWTIKADLNHDGKIDILDATRIGLHWGQTW